MVEADDQIQQALPLLHEREPSTELLEALRLLASIRRFHGDRNNAEPLIREAWDRCHELYGENHPVTLGLQARVGFHLLTRHRDEQALQITEDAVSRLKQVLPEGHVAIATAQYQLARVLLCLRQLDRAEQTVRQAIQSHERVIGKDSAFVVNDLITLARIRSAQVHHNDAVEIARDALASTVRNSSDVAMTRIAVYALLANLAVRENPRESVEMCLRELENMNRVMPDHPSLVRDLCRAASLLRRLEEWDQAESYYQQAIEVSEQIDGAIGQELGPLEEFADLLLETQKHTEAMAVFQSVVAVSANPDPVVLVDYSQAIIDSGKADQVDSILADSTLLLGLDERQAVVDLRRCQQQLADGQFEATLSTLLDSEMGEIQRTRNLRLRLRASEMIANCQMHLNRFDDDEATLFRSIKIA